MNQSEYRSHARIRHYVSSIRARILLITVAFMLLTGIIVSSFSYYVTRENIRKSLVQTSENGLSFLCSSIENNLNNVSVFVHACQTNKKINTFLSEQEKNNNFSRLEAHDTVSELYLSNSALPSQLIRMVILRLSQMDFIQIMPSTYSSASVTAEKIIQLPYFELLHTHPGTAGAGILSDPFLSTQQLPVIPYVYIMQHPYNSSETGYIFLELSTAILTQPIQDYHYNPNPMLSFDLEGFPYIYDTASSSLIPRTSDFLLIQEYSGIALDPNTLVSIVKSTSDQKKYLSVTRPVGNTDWNVTEYIDYSRVSQDSTGIFLWISFLIVLIITPLGYFLFRFLSNTIETPVKELQARMERINAGDFSRDPSTEWNHELGEIGKAINDLSENVLSLMNQRISDEKEKKDYEYRMLQSQINPHFLYNTLNSIKWMATIQCAPGIAEMTTSLSRLLKDISKGTSNLVSIEHEFALIRDYFVIQQYRYGGTITQHIEIDDEDLTQCQILKFTLQPIVENAIFHGIEPKGTAGNIRIHLYQDASSDLHIDVTDDGIGIEADVARTLLEEKNQKNHSSFFREIGISNVHKRLQYEFGPSYGLSIESVPGEYTTISVLLPHKRFVP